MSPKCLCVLLAVVVFAAAGEASVLKYNQWKWNMKGSVLVIAYGSLHMRGNHPPYPDVKTPAECASVCSDIAGCNGWTFCNKTGAAGCGSGCNNYLKGNPAIPSVDPATGRWGIPLSTKLSDLVRPGPFESLCNWNKNDTWSFGTCTLKVVSNTASPEFWSNVEAEGWVSGTIDRPAKCGNGIAARSCEKCFALSSPSLVDRCVSCAKSTAKSSSNPTPVIRTLLDRAPITTDGCAACMTLKNPAPCVACLTGKKTCGECATQQAGIRLDMQSPEEKKKTFDTQVCLDCVLVNGARTKDSCIECGRLKTSSKRKTCKACVTEQKSRVCDYSKPGQYDADCVPPSACSACADSATDPKACTQCLNQRPFNPDCISCAYAKDAARQQKCFDCAKKKTVYTSEAYSMTPCYECTALDGDTKVTDCINNCALRTDLPLSVPRYWCGYCSKGDVETVWNACYDCLVKNSTNPGGCTK